MSDRGASGPTSRRVLLVVGDDGDDGDLVGDSLEAWGFPVEALDAGSIDDVTSYIDLLPPLSGIGAAVVVLGSDIGGEAGPGSRLGHLLQLVAFLVGRLGEARLVGLAAAPQVPLLVGSGIELIAYDVEGDGGGPGPVDLLELRNRLGEALAPPPPPPGSWLSRRLQVVSPGMWVFLSPLLVLFSLLAVFGLGLLSCQPSAEEARLTSVAVDPAVLGGSRPSSQGPVVGPADSGTDDILAALPVRCVIDTSGHGVALGERIACEGLGALRREGWAGPWHNEITEVELDSGVVGSVLMEARASRPGDTRVPLVAGGVQSLEPYDPTYGVDRIELLVGAVGHRVILRQSGPRGGHEVVLTYDPGS